MATPPQLTPEQRTAALAKAAEARAARAEIKARLKMGSLTLAEALDSDDTNVGKLKVVSLLESLPGVGKVKARKVMEDIGIADNRRVQGLGSQQRACSKPSGELEQLGYETRSSSSSPAQVASARAPSSMPSCGRDPRLWLSRSAGPPARSVRASPTTPTSSPTARRSSGASPTAASSSGPSSSATTTALRSPEPAPDGADIVLEIEVDGAQQVKRERPDAILIFVLPPSRDEQERRLRGRGDADDKVVARLRKAEDEEPVGRALGRPRRRQRRPRATRSTRCWRSSSSAAGPVTAESRPPSRGSISPAESREETLMDAPRHDDEPADRGAARPRRLQVQPGHAGRPPGPQHQLLLQPAR